MFHWRSSDCRYLWYFYYFYYLWGWPQRVITADHRDLDVPLLGVGKVCWTILTPALSASIKCAGSRQVVETPLPLKQGGDGAGGNRFAEIIALQRVARQLVQDACLFARFHALGRDGQAEVFCQ